MAHLEGLLQNPRFQTEAVGMAPVLIHRVAVGVGHNGYIVGRFGPPFNFEAVHTHPGQLIDVFDHTQILGVEDVGPALVLVDRVILARALLLHQVIAPTAGLGALPAVGVAPHHVVGEQTPSGKGHAHRAVDKALELHLVGQVLADAADRIERELAREHDAAGAHAVQLARGDVVDHPSLGGDVNFEFGNHPLRGHQHPDIRDDQRVDPTGGRVAQVSRQPFHLLVGGHRIAGEIDAHPVPVRVLHRAFELLRREVGRRRTHPKLLAAQVDRIRAEQHRGLQPFPVARRGEHLRYHQFRHSLSFPMRRTAISRWRFRRPRRLRCGYSAHAPAWWRRSRSRRSDR